MSTKLTFKIIIGYKDFFKSPPPIDRLSIVAQICKKHLITELAGLNYRLKPKASKYHDTSLEKQKEELRYFCGIDETLLRKYAKILDSFTKSKEDYPLVFTRQTCIYALEEIIQSSLPIIEDFNMARVEVWNAIFHYILAVNTSITDIQEDGIDSLIDFETLNPKMLPLNELSLNSDPLYIPFRSYKLLDYLHTRNDIKNHIKSYLEQTYSFSYKKFILEIMNMYFANSHGDTKLDFFYSVSNKPNTLLDILSNVHKTSDIPKLLSLRKYPFYKINSVSYVLLDNILLLEKSYNQFINDFWFDYLKKLKKVDGSREFDIKNYKSIIGYFFENYVKEIINYSFIRAKYYKILQFDELRINNSGNIIEIADLYIRYNSKILVGQVKSTSIYDNEKYAGNIDKLYKNDRNKFFASFGLDQIVNSIKNLCAQIPFLDRGFPKNKNIKIFPIIIFNEKALQTALMGKIFQDRFTELLGEIKNNKIHIYPLSLIHISDLESLQDYLHDNHNQFWDILKYHCRNPKFMLPFFVSLNRKDIKPNYQRTMSLYETLLPKN